MSNPRKISLDFETRSLADIKKVGAFKYAEHPSTKALILAVKLGGLHDPGEILSWDIRQDPNKSDAVDLLWEAIEFGYEIHAFNSSFEWAIMKYVLPRQLGMPVPDINRLRCTAAVCRSAGLPPSLEKAAEFLELSILKDKAGSVLIQKFSVPDKKTKKFINWNDDLEFTVAGSRMKAQDAFQKFVDYCVNDVRTEMAVAHAMKPFELKGFPLEWFLTDARMNDRGVPVDRKALTNAMRLYKEQEEVLSKEFKAITQLGYNQTKRAQKWFEENGYSEPKLAKASREKAMAAGGLTDKAVRALELKSELAFAAIKKIPTMLDWIMEDGMIRGSFMWCGAQKTWRWTSRGPQYQNMKKPSKALRPVIEQAYQDVRNGMPLEEFGKKYGFPYEVVASLARYFVRYPDRNLYDLDFAQVEARVLPFLIECDRISAQFDVEGADIYTETAKSLSKSLQEKYGVDFPIDRETGKVVVLATQFQGGWNAVFTATGSKWKREWCEEAARIVRKNNPEFPAAWKQFQNAFVEAMDRPRKKVQATKYVSFEYIPSAPFPRMLMNLPSGRPICWPHPAKDPITMVKVKTTENNKSTTKWERVNGHFDSRDALAREMRMGDAFFAPNSEIESSFNTWEISFYGHIEGTQYGRVKTYGGDALQSATQATGADLLANGVIEAEKNGFPPILLVHDQCLTPAVGNPDLFVKSMCSVPDWFKGFALAAEADEVRSYCKA